jgi:hypothetical protein
LCSDCANYLFTSTYFYFSQIKAYKEQEQAIRKLFSVHHHKTFDRMKKAALASLEKKSPEKEDAAKKELAVENQSDCEDSVVKHEESTVRREQENSSARNDDAAQHDCEASLVWHMEGDGMEKSQEIAEQLQDTAAAEATDVEVCGAVHGEAADAQFTAFPRFADIERELETTVTKNCPP